MERMRRYKAAAGGRLVAVCAVFCVGIGACSRFAYEPVDMLPPRIAGAEYVGAETCSTRDCHQAEQRYFHFNQHSAVAIDITEEDTEAGVAEGCETCHGPGSIHTENRGRVKGDILSGKDPETCFGCHIGVRGKFMLQHHHPVEEGRMSCSDCHSMHGRDVRAWGGGMLFGSEDRCFKCHKEMRGPFVFEHDAMRDGCPSCHNVHGSINDKLLVAGPTITCLRCHWESRFNNSSGDIGSHAHSSHNIAAGQDCVDCHNAVHGSNIWRSLQK